MRMDLERTMLLTVLCTYSETPETLVTLFFPSRMMRLVMAQGIPIRLQLSLGYPHKSIIIFCTTYQNYQL